MRSMEYLEMEAPAEYERWQEAAACANYDPELFFPDQEMSRGRPTKIAREAINVCLRCPVEDRCLTEALNEGEEYGIWGGMTSDQRRALKRRNARRSK